MNTVGPRNSITDVPGIRVGSADDAGVRSGVTVIVPDAPMVAAVDARGGGTGSREFELLDPGATVAECHAIVLSGGSAFGLDAAGGVMTWLKAQGRGLAIGKAMVPIVPAAILFDLLNGGDKDWGDHPPYTDLGHAAADAADLEVGLGNVGAGLGATAGPLKGGLGSASVVHEDGFTVGALVAVNSLGSVLMPGCGTFWAWPFERDGEFGNQAPPPGDLPRDEDWDFQVPAGASTTLAVVATDVALTKAQAKRVAIMAQDGLARAIRPVHTPLDGDTVFAVSTGLRPISEPLVDIPRIGMLAADCVARAVARGVFEAKGLGNHPGYRDLY
jgi:L-aminopeptidase/D-esterase-like protein